MSVIKHVDVGLNHMCRSVKESTRPCNLHQLSCDQECIVLETKNVAEIKVFPLNYCLDERRNGEIHNKNSVPPWILYQSVCWWDEVGNRTNTWASHDGSKKNEYTEKRPKTIFMLILQFLLLLLEKSEPAMVKSAFIVWFESSKWIIWCLNNCVIGLVVFQIWFIECKAGLVQVQVWLRMSH